MVSDALWIKRITAMPQNPTVYLVRIGENGFLTLSIPEMKGRYLVVEQRDGRLIIAPFDADWQGPNVIASQEGRSVMLNGSIAGISPPNQ